MLPLPQSALIQNAGYQKCITAPWVTSPISLLAVSVVSLSYLWSISLEDERQQSVSHSVPLFPLPVNSSSYITGRVELRIFFCLYLLTLPFQLITTGSILTQNSSALVVLTAIHAGLVATLFWTLLANAIVATQIVEDGTLSSIIVRLLPFSNSILRSTHPSDWHLPLQPFSIFSVAFFVATTYISLDIGYSWTSIIGKSNPPQALSSIPLFVLINIWPGVWVAFSTHPRFFSSCC